MTFTQEATAITATLAGVSAPAAIVHAPQLEVSLAGVGGVFTGLDATPPALSSVNFATADALLRTSNTARATATVDLTASIVDATYQDLPDL